MYLSKLINVRTLMILALGVFTTFILVACAGKDWGDFVKVKIPVSVQKSQGLPATLTLNESEFEFEQWYDQTKDSGFEWINRNEGGRNTASMFKSLSMQMGEDLKANPAVVAIPGLGMLIGFLTKRPGDKSAAQNAEDQKASYNKARRDMLVEIQERQRAAPTSNPDQTAADILAMIKAGINKPGNANPA